jgi:hypothetical protein
MIMDDSGEGLPAVIIEIRRSSDDTLIATALSDENGEWTAAGIWGKVLISPDPDSKTGIRSFLPTSITKSSAATNVDFKAN